jgi:hypothetical protein
LAELSAAGSLVKATAVVNLCPSPLVGLTPHGMMRTQELIHGRRLDYALRAVKERLHQASFREAVITAASPLF